MVSCPICHGTVHVERTACRHCNVRFDGGFELPRLARLPAGHRQLAEELILSGGNLKVLAGRLELSYPTLRKRVDSLIEALDDLRTVDESRTDSILNDIEAERMPANEGLRRIKEINGEL